MDTGDLLTGVASVTGVTSVKGEPHLLLDFCPCIRGDWALTRADYSAFVRASSVYPWELGPNPRVSWGLAPTCVFGRCGRVSMQFGSNLH